MTRTASGKEQALVDFYAQLARDGMTVSGLAKKARVGRAALTEVLNARRGGKHTWKHVIPLLSPTALSLLKQCSAWNKYAAEMALLWAACAPGEHKVNHESGTFVAGVFEDPFPDEGFRSRSAAFLP